MTPWSPFLGPGTSTAQHAPLLLFWSSQCIGISVSHTWQPNSMFPVHPDIKEFVKYTLLGPTPGLLNEWIWKIPEMCVFKASQGNSGSRSRFLPRKWLTTASLLGKALALNEAGRPRKSLILPKVYFDSGLSALIRTCRNLQSKPGFPKVGPATCQKTCSKCNPLAIHLLELNL